MGVTVMEADFQSGACHLEFLSDRIFEPLGAGDKFWDSVRGFVGKYVHPGDRERLLAFMNQSVSEFLNQKQLGRQIHFRVCGKEAGKYSPCSCSLLRIDNGSMACGKALLVWKMEERVQGGGDGQGTGADSGMTIQEMNHGFCRMLGYSEAEVREQFQGRYRNLIYAGDREKVLRQIREQLRAGNVVEMEYRALGKDGNTVWLLDRGRLTKDLNGRDALFHILVDVTESRRAKEELRGIQERYQLILEQTEDIVVDWDIVRDTLTVSDNWRKKFGYQPFGEELTKQISLRSHIHPDDLAECTALLREMSGGKLYGEKEVRIADCAGRYRWCRIRVAAQKDEMGHPLRAVGVVADIEEEKRRSEFLQNRAGWAHRLLQSGGREAAGKAAAGKPGRWPNCGPVHDRYGQFPRSQ